MAHRRGRGRGWGRSYGGRQGFFAASEAVGAPYSREQEMQTLQAQTEHLERTLSAIKSRLAELEAGRSQEVAS
jgi:hypothetical protein